MAGFKKIIFRTTLLMLVLPALVASGLLFITYYYGDDIKQALLRELNTRLTIELSVEEIDLNLFEKFPFASMEFTTVDSKEKKSTEGKSLLKAEKVFLLFNLTDILRNKIKIQRIELEGAFLNLITRENGETNYRIYNDSLSGPGDKMEILLQKIALKNVTVFYFDQVNNHEYFFKVNNGEVRLENQIEYNDISIKGHLFSHDIKLGQHHYLNEREIDLDVKLRNHKPDHLTEILKGLLKSQGLTFELAGTMGLTKKEQQIDITLTTQKSSVDSFKDLIPPEYLKPVDDYSLDGLLGFTARIKGDLAGKKAPHLSIDFELENGDFYLREKDFALKKLAFTGHFSNGSLRSEESYEFVLDSVSSTHKAGNLRGKLNIKNFSRPEIQATFSTKIDLNELQQLVAFDQLERISGNLEMDIEFKNKLQNFRKFTTLDFVTSQTSGNLKISHVGFEIKDNPQSFSNFNGSFQFSNKDLLIKKFSGNVSGNDFSMNGFFSNVLAYLFLPDETVTIRADYFSEKLDMNKILPPIAGDSENNALLTFSHRVNFDLDVKIDTFLFRKFSATSLTGRIVQHNNILNVVDAGFNSMGGHVDLAGSINGFRNDNYVMHCYASVDKVNIRRLFYEFGDFGQQNITHNHLLGQVTAKVDYRSSLSPSLHVEPASVICFADIEINDGELIGYEPIYKLSRYIKEEELKHIKFSQLKNKIKIENEVIYFPEMDILSSSLNIKLYGNHSFSNVVDYHIQLLVSDIIARKEKIKQDMGDNFEQQDETGKTKLFLHMTGDASNPDIRYDTKEVRKKIATDLANEKKELKDILAKEFKWGSGNQRKNEINDTIVKTQKDFIIEWEEPDSSIQKQSPQKKKKEVFPKKDEKDFIISWDEENDTIK